MARQVSNAHPNSTRDSAGDGFGRDRARNRAKPRRRFRYRLRTLFAINLAAAVLFDFIRLLLRGNDLTSTCVWIGGTLAIIVMAFMGDAIDRDRGAIVGTIFGIVTWLGLILLGHGLIGLSVGNTITTWQKLLNLNLPVQTLAIVATACAIIVPAVRSSRQQDEVDGKPPLAHRLLENQRQRRNSHKST